MRPDTGTGREYAEIRGEAVGANSGLRFPSTNHADRTLARKGSKVATAAAEPTHTRLEVEELVLGINWGLVAGEAER